MDIIKNISYKVSKELAQKCKNESTGNQIAIINQSIFEDSKINHIKRLKYQYELLKFSETKKSTFNSAYILNLIAQTNTQMGNLSTALDNLLSAEKKWNQVLKQEHGINGLILCIADIGNIYMKMGLFDQSMKYFESALEYVDSSDSLFVPYFKVHYHLSEIYNELNFDIKSKEMIKKCISRVQKYKFPKKNRSYIYLIPAHMHLAKLYLKDKNYSLALDTYNKTLKMCDLFDDVIYKQQILIEMGEIQIELSDFKKAKRALQKAEKMHQKIGSDSRLIDIKSNLSKIFINLNQYEDAKQVLEDAKEVAEKNKQELKLITIYENLSKVYECLNIPDKSFFYNKKHAKLISDYYINKNNVLIDENRKVIKDLSSAIKEKHEIEITKDLELNKKYKIRNQTTKTLYRIRENNILESLRDDIYKIKENISNKEQKHLNKMLNKISSHLQDESSWKDFETMFMQIHDDFVINLKNKCKTLSQKQIRFCMFIKMGMDKYDICSLLNVTNRAIEQQRYRIRKKLNYKGNLDEFIQEL